MQNPETTLFSLFLSVLALVSPFLYCTMPQVYSVYQLWINKKCSSNLLADHFRFFFENRRGGFGGGVRLNNRLGGRERFVAL
jgi:hypothetical protein